MRAMMMRDLIQQIDRYCEKHSLPPTTFGRVFMRDPNFIGALRAGRECLPSTVARLEAAMKSPPPVPVDHIHQPLPDCDPDRPNMEGIR